MITFLLNNKQIHYQGDGNISLLNYLRNDLNITSAKDGCSGQATCGACTVEINGKARLACSTKMKTLSEAEIFTMEGLPDNVKETIAKTFVNCGAVQCGFCTPGFIMRAWNLFKYNPNPTHEEIQKAIHPNLCRCTGYKKIEEAIKSSAIALSDHSKVEITDHPGLIGSRLSKYEAYETALGIRPFVDDIKIEGILHAALKFTDHPRARIIKIDVSKALQLNGVVKIFTAKDIPGDKYIGLIYNDWPLMIDENEITHYIGDVLAGVLAGSAEIARKAVELIEVEYEVLKPIDSPYGAMKETERVHENHTNILGNCILKRGDLEVARKQSFYISQGFYETQRIEHAFLEPEAAIAYPDNNRGIVLLSQGQGVYEDRRQVAQLLGLSEEKVRVKQIACGGGFGGREDLTVQGHVALFSYLLGKPVKLVLFREESIMMHPKRHPVYMDIEVGADKTGKLIYVKLDAVGDSGAYASVGTKVMERVAGHACGAYFIPIVDVAAKTVYTNNIPSGAMRGFGVPQIAFALEGCIDELCEMGNFDRWKFRYDNALTDGLMTSTGQKVYQVGVRACLDALKEKFYSSKYSGIACGIKNCGVGNGMPDYSNVRIDIISESEVVIHHGWTEMGQGVHTVAIQTLCNETGLNPNIIRVIVDTDVQLKTGMTTSSRATVLLGNAIIDASKELASDLKNHELKELSGRSYIGGYICDWTTKPGDNVPEPITHFAYGYAAQLCVLNENGDIDTFYAAHDAGKIINPVLFEGQIEGSVHMGIGYALTEDLPMKGSKLISKKLKDCQVLRSDETPKIVVIGVEVTDKNGPYGAKGIGEIGLVPTAAAVANAMYQFDKVRRYKLPVKRK